MKPIYKVEHMADPKVPGSEMKKSFNEDELLQLREGMQTHVLALERRHLDYVKKQGDARIIAVLAEQIEKAKELRKRL